MADRVPVSISIGGTLPASEREAFAAIVADEGLSVAWGGPAFSLADLVAGAPLQLFAHEVAWGRLDHLEAYCVARRLAFVRWSGGYGCEWSPELVVFTGAGAPRTFLADESERVVIDRAAVERLGSHAAVLGYFADAAFVVPPLC